MKKSLKTTAMLLLMIITAALTASAQSPVKWATSVKMTSKTEGVMTITGTIEKGWHLYGFTQPADGPQATTVTMSPTKGVVLKGKLRYSPKPVSQMEEMFGATVSYWENKVTFTRKFKIQNANTGSVTVNISYMMCNDSSCRPPQTDTLTIKVK